MLNLIGDVVIINSQNFSSLVLLIGSVVKFKI